MRTPIRILAWCLTPIAGVWSAEAMNTALKLLCDATCPEFHPAIGKAKDVAAGASSSWPSPQRRSEYASLARDSGNLTL